jgi:hypothetical protein
MYRIAWRSLLTGYAGHGQFVFPTREEIESHVAELNRNYTGEMTHWIESDKDLSY